jgi:hypothetical protein
VCADGKNPRGRVVFLVSPVGGATLESSEKPHLAAGPHGACLLLQLASDLLEEPDCTICEGSDPHIAWFGIAAEEVSAAIWPGSTMSRSAHHGSCCFRAWSKLLWPAERVAQLTEG